MPELLSNQADRCQTKLTKNCLFGNKLYKITGFVSMTPLKPGFYKTLQQLSTDNESVLQI